MTIEERGTAINLSHKVGDSWHLLQYNATTSFDKMNEEECKQAFEEMVFEMRRRLHDKFIIEKQ